MSELAVSNAKKPGSPSSDLFSELFNVFFFLLSHPLYFSYVIFFSPYLLRLFSFLSPLFVTTTLLVLAFLAAAERRSSKPAAGEEDLPSFEDLEVYKIVFDVSAALAEIAPDPVEVVKETCDEEIVDKCLIAHDPPRADDGAASEESLKWTTPEKKAETKTASEKVNKEEAYFASPEWDFDDKYSVKSVSAEGSPANGSSLGSFGSTRKEKEWRRTLACKLFEERHNYAAEGSEGMDLLWETYEAESDKKTAKTSAKKGKRNALNRSDEDEEDEEFEEDETNAQLCCLQALKFSAGKMNLGMGRPNLVKFSKAFKGIGWLHNVTRHGKKRYN